MNKLICELLGAAGQLEDNKNIHSSLPNGKNDCFVDSSGGAGPFAAFDVGWPTQQSKGNSPAPATNQQSNFFAHSPRQRNGVGWWAGMKLMELLLGW